MLEKCKNAKERWGGVSDLIDGWLEERQRVISLFVHLPNELVNEELDSQVQRFCQVLMDYISSGHFGVYEQLISNASEFDENSVQQGQELLNAIQVSTDTALDFNDGLVSLEQPTVRVIKELSDRLSDLGEALEERFELEDKMIDKLHTAYKEEAQG